MLTLTPKYARLSHFRSATPKILCGSLLRDVKRLQHSIKNRGLTSPLITTKIQNRLIVIDGRKRLMALRRLRFNGNLPASLSRIPYILADQGCKNSANPEPKGAGETYLYIKTFQKAGKSVAEIALNLSLPQDTIRDYLKLDALSPRLKEAFIRDTLTLEQASALVTLANPNAQDSLLTYLGAFAKEPDVLSAVSRGQTVLPISEDNVIILPSRKRTYAAA